LGRFQSSAQIDAEQRKEWIDSIKLLPSQMREAVDGLDEAQLETPYRAGGWTVRQVVHHVADSHMNSYIRFRWALTEDSPLIKAYEEALWAELPDAKAAPIALSLSLLEAMHARWVMLLESMDDAAFARTLKHPQLGDLKLDWLLGLYAWHGRHHTAHITTLRNQLQL
jgi:uncharacterized damage-inducible protein DinB